MIIVNIAISMLAIVVLQMAGMYVFSIITPFQDMEELKRGNVAVGLVMAGEFLSTAMVLGIAAYTNSSIWHMALWFLIGYVCLVLTYWVFEWATPSIKVSEHLQQGNVAVGMLLAAVFIGIAFAISSLII